MSSKVKPRFQVEELEGEVEHEIIVKGENGELTKKKVTEPAGYMVYFPSGGSIRVRTKEELERLEFHKNPKLIDMESGDEVGEMPTMDLKRLSQQKSGRSKSSQGAAMANVGDE